MRDDITLLVKPCGIVAAAMPPGLGIGAREASFTALALFAAFAGPSRFAARASLALRARNARQRAHLGQGPLTQRKARGHRLDQRHGTMWHGPLITLLRPQMPARAPSRWTRAQTRYRCPERSSP